MPDLYVSTLGVPFRAVIARGSGERAFVRIGERADDDFALDPVVWIDQFGAATGAQALLLERSGAPGRCFRLGPTEPDADDDDALCARDVLAATLRRLLSAAETQSGEPIQRVVCVVSGDADDETRSECAQAALLAGAQIVEILAASGADALLEGWDDRTRLTLTESGNARSADLSATLSRTVLRALFRQSIGLAPDARDAHAAAADMLFDTWASGKDVARGMSVTLAAARGAPVAAYAPASVFAALDSALRERLAAALTAHGAVLATIAAFDVSGSWTQPLGRALRALAGANTTVRDERGVELDRAIRAAPPQARATKPTLGSDVFATPESPRTLRALAQGEPVRLLSAGTRLPATSISESFRSSSFLGAFRVVAQRDGTSLPLMTIPIPRYAERQADSYLRAVVHADTDDVMFVEVAYLYSARRRFAFVEKRSEREVPLSDHVFRVVRG
jgi:hypothetical protein